MRTGIALATLLSLAGSGFAQARPPKAPDAAKARKALVRTLERHAVLIDGLVRNLDARVTTIERRGPRKVTDENVTARAKSAMRTEGRLARREAALGAVPGAANDRTAELARKVAASRERVADRLRRLVALVPDLDPSVVTYWESPAQPAAGPTSTAVTNPGEFAGWVTLEQPESIDEFLGTAAGIEERYLSNKK